MLSIIIPTLREEQYIERTLKNIEALGDIPHEIIISDGGSDDKTLEIVHRYTNKVVVWDRAAKGRRQTFGEAKNMGAALASGDFLVFIDADIIIPKPREFYTEMLAEFEKKPELVGMTVPLKPLPECKRFFDPLFGGLLNIFYVISNNYFYSGNASGEFQMIRKSAFDKIHGYRENLSAGEDNECFRELADIGRTYSYSKLAAYHTFRRPHKVGWLKLYYIWIKNGIYVALLKRGAYKEWDVVR